MYWKTGSKSFICFLLFLFYLLHFCKKKKNNDAKIEIWKIGVVKTKG